MAAVEYNTPMTAIGAIYPGAPVPERLTLQREVNDLLDQVVRAHAIMDQFSPVPSSPGGNAALLPLGQGMSACREQMARLVERIDGLFSRVGEV